MPNPNANKPLTFEQIKADAMSMGIPVRALMDMIASGARSSVATTLGLPSDLANTAIGVHNMAKDIRRGKFQGYEPGTIPMGSEQIKEFIPDVSKDPNSNLNKMADFGGSFAVIPGSGKLAMKGLKSVGQEIADRVATGQGLIPKVGEPQMAMHVIKPEKGGNWISNNTESSLNELKENTLLKNKKYYYGPEHDKAVEDRIKELKNEGNEGALRVAQHLEDNKDKFKKLGALNQWIDTNLRNYIRNDMATSHDPIRLGIEQRVAKVEANNAKEQKKIAKLDEKIAQARQSGDEASAKTMEATRDNLATEAEDAYELGMKHTAHVPHENFNFNTKYWGQNSAPWNDQKWMATTEPSKAWEGVADNSLGKAKGSLINSDFDLYKSLREQQPELKNISRDANVYNIQDPKNFGNDLGFDHVVDTIKQHLDLPENDKYHLKPEQLKNISVPQMMERVANHNLERELASRNVALQQQEGFPIVKEYPSGHKWIELAPKEVKSKADLGDLGLQSYFDYMKSGGDEAYALKAGQKADAKKYLEEALKYEGDTMGHCVGGYCPDVLEGRTRIFSLRDKRGEPHVTIEVRTGKHPIGFSTKGRQSFPNDFEYGGIDKRLPEDQHQAVYNRAKQIFDNLEYETPMSVMESFNQAANEIVGKPTSNIHQIKGKGNQAPVDKYLPMVQEFQRTTGFPIKGDIHNSGFVDTHPELKKLGESIGLKVPDYLTKDEENVLRQQVAPHIESMVKNANDFLDTHPAFEPHRQATREFNDALGKEFSTNEPVYTQQEMNELERRSVQSIHPEFPYHFSEIKKVLNNPEEHGEGDPLKTQLYNLGKINELRNKVGDVPTAQPTLPIEPTQGFASGGAVQHQGFINPSLKLANGSVTLNPMEFMPNYLSGGKVHVSDDLDMMRHELNTRG